MFPFQTVPNWNHRIRGGSLNKIIFATLALALSACAPMKNNGVTASKSLDSIVGGEAATAQDAFTKSTVAVIDMFQGGTCTGTLLAKDIVVTAAHCVQSGEAFLQVGFGLDLDKATTVKTEKSQFHERFTQAMTELEDILQKIVDATVPGTERQQKIFAALDEYKNWGDVALLKLKEPAPAGYEPAEILEDGRYVQNGSTILLAGYGITKPYSEQKPDDKEANILRKVEIKVHNAVFSETEVSFDQTEGKGACHGDSGGPAYVKVGDKLKLFGVTSRGLSDPDDSCRKYSGYTYLPAHTKWMADTLAAWAKTPAQEGQQGENAVAANGNSGN